MAKTNGVLESHPASLKGLNQPLVDAKAGDKSTKKTPAFVNIRFVGVGFRAYVVKKPFKEAEENFIFNDSPSLLDNSDPLKGVSDNLRFLHEDNGIKSLRFLILKVGQSALTAYPIPNSIQVYCPKDQQADKDAILLKGNNLQELKQMTAEIKSYRIPDPYKGSGIYTSQRIETDEGETFENERVFRKAMKKK